MNSNMSLKCYVVSKGQSIKNDKPTAIPTFLPCLKYPISKENCGLCLSIFLCFLFSSRVGTKTKLSSVIFPFVVDDSTPMDEEAEEEVRPSDERPGRFVMLDTRS